MIHESDHPSLDEWDRFLLHHGADCTDTADGFVDHDGWYLVR